MGPHSKKHLSEPSLLRLICLEENTQVICSQMFNYELIIMDVTPVDTNNQQTMIENSRFLLLLYRYHQSDFHLLTLTPSKLETVLRPPIFLVLVWDTIFVVYWSPNSAHFICGQLGYEGKSSYAVTFCTTNINGPAHLNWTRSW